MLGNAVERANQLASSASAPYTLPAPRKALFDMLSDTHAAVVADDVAETVYRTADSTASRSKRTSPVSSYGVSASIALSSQYR